MKSLKQLPLFLALLAPALIKGQGGSWEVPIDSRTQEGNSQTVYPFSAGYTRYQQLNAASDFGSSIGGTVIGPGGVLLRGMYLRLDSPIGFSFGGYATNLQVNLSTTLRQPDSLSPVFFDNVGANDQIVFGPATPRLAGDHTGSSPEPWTTGVLIQFDQPFLYLPTEGNLLLDIRLFNGSTAAGFLDAWNRPGDSVSSVYGDIADLSGTTSTLGISILFSGTVVPEPSTYALFALGAAALLFLRKKRKS